MVRILLLLTLTLGACNGRDFAGPEEPAALRIVTTFTYRVEGTYAHCDIRYRHPVQGDIQRAGRTLPWETALTVEVTTASGPFDARVQATCTDSERHGKSTAMILVDERIRATGSAAGPGATANASLWIGEEVAR